jgi:plastocyanin
MNFTEISLFVIRFPSPSRKAGMTASEFDNKVDTPQFNRRILRGSRLALLAAVGAVAVALMAACSGGSSEKALPASAGLDVGAQSVPITVKTFMFRPDPLQIRAGATVIWTNQDEILHTVTSGVRSYDAQGLTKDVSKDEQFDFQLNGKGSTASFTFKSPGTIRYLCTRHPGMDAQIIVR